MKNYYRHFIRTQLEELFEGTDLETVLSWFTSNRGRLPTVVVGAGFSRNATARDGSRAASARFVPLWADIAQRFATDLGLSTNDRDALTLADLHAEEMGIANSQSTLLELLPDGELAPGPAHRSLFGYSVSAIVTTNFMDTLLDKNEGRWARIVVDADLALRSSPGAVELLYLHGHRDRRETWVLTRSQYEDLHRSRPLIMTRVRQLLSQNPVLLVGFSLTDPDFHQVYRQISLDMTYRHPLGLALFPAGGGPKAPERRHWERLGIRSVEFKGGPRSVGDSLTLFFKWRPDVHPRGTPEERAHARGRIDALPSFVERCQMAQEILDDYRNAKPPVPVYAEREVWLMPLMAEMPGGEWDADGRLRVNDEGQVVEVDDPTKLRRLRELPPRLANRVEALLWQFDGLIARRPGLVLPIANWISVALQREGLDRAEPVLLEVGSFLWQRVLAGDPASELAKEGMRLCVARALKWGLHSDAQVMRSDAAGVGVELSDVTAGSDRGAGYLSCMRDALRASLDADFALAEGLYQEAVAVARREDDDFGVWLAAHGRVAMRAATRTFDAGTSSELEAAQHLVQEIEQSQAVRRWLARADRVKSGLVEELRQYLAAERSDRWLGGDQIRFTSTPYECWQAFRELETAFAPAGLQREHLGPLLDLELFDVREYVAYRLRFELDSTERDGRWLRRILWTAPEVSRGQSLPEAARRRDESVLAAFDAASHTKTERVARLATFPYASAALMISNLDGSRQFVERARAEIGTHAISFRSRRNLVSEYADYWLALSQLETRQGIMDGVAEYARVATHPLELEAIASRIRRFPLRQWAMAFQSLDTVFGAVFLLCDRAPGDMRVLQACCAAATQGLRALQQAHVPVSDGILQRVTSIAALAAEATSSEGRGDLSNSFAQLQYMLAADDSARSAVLERHLARFAMSARAGRPALEADLRLYLGLSDLGISESNGVMVAARQALVGQLGAQWHVVEAAAGNSSDTAVLAAEVLALELAAGGDAKISRLLIDVVGKYPAAAVALGGVLDLSRWGDNWSALVELIHRVGVGERADSTSGRRALIDLLRRWCATPVPVELHQDLQFLVYTTMLDISDARYPVATRAASAVVALGRRGHGPFDREVCRALKTLAEDIRTANRACGAYGAALLAVSGGTEEVRAAAEQCRTTLEKDPYAMVGQGLWAGHLEGAARMARALGSRDPVG